MKEYIEDTTAMIIYALQFIVPPIIAGALLGQTAERFAFGLSVAYLAGKRASIFIQLKHAEERAKKYLEEEGNENETN